MELYLKIGENKIIDVHTEQIDESYTLVDVKDINELYEKTQNYSLDEEIEERAKELLEQSADNTTLNSFNIKHWVSNRSFGELIDMYENGEIKKPDMQREFVWDSLKCSRLIESIIIGLPIPPLFLLEIDKNKYEIIDGFQRLTTLTNYVSGHPWYNCGNENKRKSAARLSKKISSEIAGKTFEQLAQEHQRTIKRNTIPLIEFKQLDPDNYNSKYLIFERINTGSEKLNPMQIRKSLAHGTFMKSLYKNANAYQKFLDLFSTNNIKKDAHVEAFLRIKVMGEIHFKIYVSEKTGINNILNEYCERNIENDISDDYLNKFKSALAIVYKVFGEPVKMFKRVEKDDNGEYCFPGNMNVSILEAFFGVLINMKCNQDATKVLQKYKEEMFKVKTSKENPFTTSTGTLESINNRFLICRNILEE